MKWNLLFLSLMLFFLIMCDREKDIVGSSDSVELVPLKIGNTWLYTSDNDVTFNDSIDSVRTINGADVYWLNSQRLRWTAQQGIYNSPDGYYVDHFIFPNENNHDKVFKYPCTKGMKWSNTNVFFGITVTEHYEVLSTLEKVEISSGVYYCCVYKITSMDTKMIVNNIEYYHYTEYYFAPNIGMVLKKQVITDENFKPLDEFEEIVARELVEYSLVR